MPNEPSPASPTPPRAITLTLPRLRRRHLIVALSGLGLAVIVAISAIWYLRENTATIGIPHSLTARTTFPLYYPRQLPSDFKLNPKSFYASSDLLSYSYTYQGQKQLFVTIQPLTPDISTANFRPTDTLTLSIGKAYIADLDGVRTTAAVTTEKSFMLINVPGQISRSVMNQFLESLRPAR